MSSFVSPSQNQLFARLGYISTRWNYLEDCSRQILRMYVEGESLDAPDHLEISRYGAIHIERRLDAISAHWVDEGKPFLDCLIRAFTRAREYRNHLIHGAYMTVGARGPYEAHVILVPSKPIGNYSQHPSHITLSELTKIADHVHELAMFAREIMIGFDKNGNRALNSDGTPVLLNLPNLIEPLDPCKYVTDEGVIF